MRFGKKLAAAITLATCAFVVSTPASARGHHSGNVVAGVIVGMITGAVLASANSNNHQHTTTYVAPAQPVVVQPVVYSQPVTYVQQPVYYPVHTVHTTYVNKYKKSHKEYKEQKKSHKHHKTSHVNYPSH